MEEKNLKVKTNTKLYIALIGIIVLGVLVIIGSVLGMARAKRCENVEKPSCEEPIPEQEEDKTTEIVKDIYDGIETTPYKIVGVRTTVHETRGVGIDIGCDIDKMVDAGSAEVITTSVTAEDKARVTYTRGETTVNLDRVVGCAGFVCLFFSIPDAEPGVAIAGDKVNIGAGVRFRYNSIVYEIEEAMEFIYENNVWDSNIENKEWKVSEVTGGSIYEAQLGPLGVDVRGASKVGFADSSAMDAFLLKNANNKNLVTYQRGEVIEHPSYMVGTDGYVYYGFKGKFANEAVGAKQGDRFIVEEGFTFLHHNTLYYYPSKLDYTYNGTKWVKN